MSQNIAVCHGGGGVGRAILNAGGGAVVRLWGGIGLSGHVTYCAVEQHCF